MRVNFAVDEDMKLLLELCPQHPYTWCVNNSSFSGVRMQQKTGLVVYIVNIAARIQNRRLLQPRRSVMDVLKKWVDLVWKASVHR